MTKVLMGLGFLDMLSEASAQTQTGSELLKNYQSYLMNYPVSCGLVNNFIKEAANTQYDTGVSKVLERITDYLTMNKVGWQIASVCENIQQSTNNRDYLKKNAANQASKLLEMEEEDIVKYIRSGALKNIMFCEDFRSIAKGVFQESPRMEINPEYTKYTPISLVENVGDSVAFVVAGRLFLQDNLGQVQESKEWDRVSQTFKIVESLLESKLVEIEENEVIVKYNNQTYKISENGIVHGEKGMSLAELREENELYLRVANPLRKREMAQVLESIALLAENFDRVAKMDNVQIYATPRERFLVIENQERLFASALNGAWQVNENAMKTLDFIKSRTNIQLSENYSGAIEKSIEKADEENKQAIEESLRDNTVADLKERIERLTVKFKNDPAKLAVLAQCASQLS